MIEERTLVEELWKRVSAGRHTAVVGLVIGDPPTSAGVRLVRVSCDVPLSTLGPLLDARRKVERVLGGSPALFDQARHIVVAGLRRRLLGDEPPGDGADGAIVETLNRLARQEGMRSALLFDAIDAADEATLDALRQIIRRAGWLELPLILSFRRPNPQGKAAALLDALRAADGPSAVLVAPRAEAPSPSNEAGGELAASSARGADVKALSPEVLRVLRAGALIGTGFEAELVAALLRVEPLDVIESLQRAVDAGVPIDDRGEGRFHLSEPLVDALRASLLPSLSRAWHRRLASLLSGEDKEKTNNVVIDTNLIEGDVSAPAEAPSAPGGPWPYSEIFGQPAEAPAPPPPDVESAAPAPEPGSTAPLPTSEASAAPEQAAPEQAAPERENEPTPEAPPPEAPRAAEATPPEVVTNSIENFSPSEPEDQEGAFDDTFVASAPDMEAPPPRPGAWINPFSMPPEAPRPRPEGASERAAAGQRRGDEARAAGHLTAAGEVEEAAERYAAAARNALAAGAYAQALTHGKRALDLLSELPVSTPRRRLRASVLAELGRLQWLAAGPDLPFTLAGALDALSAARSLLNDGDPVQQRADIAALIAGVCYDLGDMRSLERALDELTSASRAFLSVGDAVGAARLLNDQAAVYVRMGDPVRATHLLSESRKVFENRGANDPIAMIELAETDHLFARIPLHVAARPGREQDALSMGLDHALAAERTYKKIGAKRELGRVWETMGRLELAKGRPERAEGRLAAAIQVQRAIGDVLGLARTTAVLSEVLAARGRTSDALALLGDSIALNLEKGSPIGLAFNRRSLDALAEKAPPGLAPQGLLSQVAARLARAESALGRMKLPGELD